MKFFKFSKLLLSFSSSLILGQNLFAQTLDCTRPVEAEFQEKMTDLIHLQVASYRIGPKENKQSFCPNFPIEQIAVSVIEEKEKAGVSSVMEAKLANSASSDDRARVQKFVDAYREQRNLNLSKIQFKLSQCEKADTSGLFKRLIEVQRGNKTVKIPNTSDRVMDQLETKIRNQKSLEHATDKKSFCDKATAIYGRIISTEMVGGQQPQPVAPPRPSSQRATAPTASIPSVADIGAPTSPNSNSNLFYNWRLDSRDYDFSGPLKWKPQSQYPSSVLTGESSFYRSPSLLFETPSFLYRYDHWLNEGTDGFLSPQPEKGIDGR